MKNFTPALSLFLLFFLFFITDSYGQMTGTLDSQTNVTCFGGNDGTATVSQSGGTGPYTYSWTTGGSAATETGLIAGSFTCTITDQFDMSTATVTVSITEPPQLVNTTLTSNDACNGCDGSAAAAYTGGTGSYTYSWMPSGQVSPTPGNLCSGLHTVTVSDANGCSVSDTITVAGSVFITACPDIYICNNGTINLSAIATGASPFTYSWTGPNAFSSAAQNPSLPNASIAEAGTYMVSAFGSNGCSASDIVEVYINSGPVINFITTDAACNQSNGSITAQVAGGNAPYTYMWSTNQTTSTISGLPAGTYTFTVTDSNGCTTTSAVGINNTNGPAVSMTNAVNTTCYQSSDGQATATASGSAPPFTYLWNTSPAQTTATATGLPAGQWLCSVTDTSNCQTTASVTIQQPPQLYLGAYTLAYSNCGADGTGLAWALGGTLPYSWQWSSGSTNDTATNLPVGTHTITVTDATGCTVQNSFAMLPITATIIKGRVYADLNANCIFDGNDFAIQNQVILVNPDDNYFSTDANGFYTAITYQTGTKTISVLGNFSSPYTTAFCPPSATQNVAVATLCDTILNVDFSREETPGMQDLRASMGQWAARPGMSQLAYLHYWNVGTVPVNNCVLTYAYDSILTFDTCAVMPDTILPGRAVWLLGTLQPNYHGSLVAYLNVPTMQNGGYIGRPLAYTLTIEPVTGDQTPADNSFATNMQITASYDPNEKIVYAAGLDSLGRISPADTLLSYTIFFQNTGTDTAFNIYIEDTLSSYLNAASIMPGASSFPYTFEMLGNSLIRFNFYNILLPDSNRNEPGSHGFVEYRIKTQPNLPVGTIIENTAAIYFDFNPAVWTNTTSNEIWVDVPTAIAGKPDVRLLMNTLLSGDDRLLISGLQEHFQVEIYDAQGRRIYFSPNYRDEFSAAAYVPGIYIVQVTTGNGGIVRQKICIVD